MWGQKKEELFVWPSKKRSDWRIKRDCWQQRSCIKWESTKFLNESHCWWIDLRIKFLACDCYSLQAVILECYICPVRPINQILHQTAHFSICFWLFCQPLISICILIRFKSTAFFTKAFNKEPIDTFTPFIEAGVFAFSARFTWPTGYVTHHATVKPVRVEQDKHI